MQKPNLKELLRFIEDQQEHLRIAHSVIKEAVEGLEERDKLRQRLDIYLNKERGKLEDTLRLNVGDDLSLVKTKKEVDLPIMFRGTFVYDATLGGLKKVDD